MTTSPMPGAGSPIERDVMEEQISMYAIGTALLRGWRRLAALAFAGAVVALAMVFTKPRLYSATFAFVPQGADATRSGLASLAGQFGILTPGANPSSQPEFYVALVQSREILAPVLADSFTVDEEGQRRASLLDLLRIRGAGDNRIEVGLKKLRSRMSTTPVKTAGIVRVAVRTEWPSVSLAISQRVLAGINAYNVRARQTQAAAERKFVEARLADARDSLRAAEDRLQAFLATNRQGVESSPHLKSAWQRLERDVASKATIATSLAQEYEDVRIREVRDTPTIAVFETPVVATIPEPRGRAMTTILGFVLGGGFGVILIVGSAAMRRQQALRDPEADEFFEAIVSLKAAVLRRLPSRRS